MLRSFSEIIRHAQERGPARIAVACAADREVLSAVRSALDLGIAEAVCFGDRDAIRREADEAGFSLAGMEILQVPDPGEACAEAVRRVSSGSADILMKGLVDTSVILKAVLNPESGLRTGSILSHVAVFDVPGWDRLFLVTDAAMNIAPDLAAKASILRNAVTVAHALGLAAPKAAVLCAKEKVDPKMRATLDAEALCGMNRNGEISGCLVGGPLALDNAVSLEAAVHKGITGPVAGNADILLAPDIESANILYKSMVFFARADAAGVLVGARAPVVITSRADSDTAKLHSIALSVVLAKAGRAVEEAGRT